MDGTERIGSDRIIANNLHHNMSSIHLTIHITQSNSCNHQMIKCTVLLVVEYTAHNDHLSLFSSRIVVRIGDDMYDAEYVSGITLQISLNHHFNITSFIVL